MNYITMMGLGNKSFSRATLAASISNGNTQIEGILNGTTPVVYGQALPEVAHQCRESEARWQELGFMICCYGRGGSGGIHEPIKGNR